MLLKSIKLHNIRSYESQQIDFPLGSVLLAGDIGSGKSTILLAIEFAIFGAKKGELPAYTLLRHGKKEGSVELKMQIGGKDITIKRALKRGNGDIRQEAGYIIVNGIKKEGTAEELRAAVLDMLGYPKELVKKGKDLIYRYTVYTPQEEMKHILYENNEARLDTLRKVFNIDKYKRIKDNAKIIAAYLREKKRHLEGFIFDLESKRKNLDERRTEISELDKRISSIIPKIGEIRKAINEKTKSFRVIEKDIMELNSLRGELDVTEANLRQMVVQNNRLNDEIRILEKHILELKKEVEGKDIRELGEIIKKTDETEGEISEADASYRDIIKKISGLEAKISQSRETVKKVLDLEICPVCEQKVDEGHKHNISLREGKKHDELVEQVRGCREAEAKLDKVKHELKKKIDSLMKEQNHLNILKIKFENLNEKSSSKEEKSLLKEKIKKEIGSLNSKKLELCAKILTHAGTEEKYKIIRKEIDDLLPQEKFLELEKNKYETEKGAILRFIAGMEREISEKQKAKERLGSISQLAIWLDELFINLMSSIEKHVMVNIHSEFNELFKKWFDMLLEDETISVRVDADFTPVIEQNGYETYIENLSGGEKTSVALSYRLALNKVVNDIVAGIRTKDIIMLDEPTDGFSTEQLDKIRDVISQLNMKQVILVSHESKIESFVENVIRVEKHEHVSLVV